MIMNVNRFIRGSVWWYNRYTTEQGITRGDHPCVVISSDDWNDKASNVIIIPCTSDTLIGTVKGVKLGLNNTSGSFFVSQITTVPKKQLFHYQGMLNEKELNILNNSLECILGIDEHTPLSMYVNTEKRLRNGSHLKDRKDENFEYSKFNSYPSDKYRMMFGRNYNSTRYNSGRLDGHYDSSQSTYGNYASRDQLLSQPSIVSNIQTRPISKVWTDDRKRKFVEEMDSCDKDSSLIPALLDRYNITYETAVRYYRKFK